jgi:hypothetical protein
LRSDNKVLLNLRAAFREFHPLARGLVVIATLLATAYTTRLAIYMVDESRTSYSVFDREFFRNHSCLSSYTEAARLAPTGANIFDPAVYSQVPSRGELAPRYIGTFEVDLYQYPPAFLILPTAAEKVGLDFFAVRTLWFVIQIGILIGALLAAANWIGGTRGAVAAMFIPLIFLAPTTRVALQLGNFQLTAFPVAVLAMIAFASRGASRSTPTLVGGAALGFCAVSKIFPGVLGIVLLMQRRWTAAAATVAAGAIFTVLALLTVGTKPFVDFLYYQLPRIDSGEAFFWIENPEIAPLNQSVYGLVTKLRALGLPGTSAAAANLASSIYAVLLMAVAVVGARRLQRFTETSPEASLVRLRHAQVWLGLLTLASLRSPFVPDAYGLVGTLWLLSLIAAERRRLQEWGALVVAGAAFSIVLDGGLVPTPVPVWMTVASLAIQLAAFGINFYVVLAPSRAVLTPGSPSGHSLRAVG